MSLPWYPTPPIPPPFVVPCVAPEQVFTTSGDEPVLFLPIHMWEYFHQGRFLVPGWSLPLRTFFSPEIAAPQLYWPTCFPSYERLAYPSLPAPIMESPTLFQEPPTELISIADTTTKHQSSEEKEISLTTTVQSVLPEATEITVVPMNEALPATEDPEVPDKIEETETMIPYDVVPEKVEFVAGAVFLPAPQGFYPCTRKSKSAGKPPQAPKAHKQTRKQKQRKQTPVVEETFTIHTLRFSKAELTVAQVADFMKWHWVFADLYNRISAYRIENQRTWNFTQKLQCLQCLRDFYFILTGLNMKPGNKELPPALVFLQDRSITWHHTLDHTWFAKVSGLLYSWRSYAANVLTEVNQFITKPEVATSVKVINGFMPPVYQFYALLFATLWQMCAQIRAFYKYFYSMVLQKKAAFGKDVSQIEFALSHHKIWRNMLDFHRFNPSMQELHEIYSKCLAVRGVPFPDTTGTSSDTYERKG